MRAGETIRVLAAELLDETRQRVTPENFIKHDREYAESALLRAVIRYLEVQSVVEERRAALRTALANIGPGCDVDQLNQLLEKAGITYRAVEWDSFQSAREMILMFAEREGLL